MMLFVSNGDFLVEAIFDAQSLQTRICYIAMLSQTIQLRYQTIKLWCCSLSVYCDTCGLHNFGCWRRERVLCLIQPTVGRSTSESCRLCEWYQSV